MIGVPDAEMGEAVKAVIELVDPTQAGAGDGSSELLTFCRERTRVASSVPKSIDFTDELPRSDNGKLYKRVLREPYWAGHETSI